MANIQKTFNFRNGVQVDNDNLIVNSFGLVGIGTSVPTELLDVRGTTKIVGLLTVSETTTRDFITTGIATIRTAKIGIVSITSYGIVTATSGSGIVTYYGDGGRLLNLPTSQWLDIDVGLGFTSIYNTGYVGIATNDPRFLLQIGGNNNIFNFRDGVGISSSGNIVATGIVTAYSFVGYGTQLSGLNASNITNGTLNSNRLPGIPNSNLPSNISVSGIITAQNGFSGNLDGINVNASGIVTAGTIANVGNINSSGIITSGNINSSGIITAASITYVGNINSSGIITSGNINSSGIITASSITYVRNINSTGIITASNGINANLTGNVNASGLSTFSSGIKIGTASTIVSPSANVLTLYSNGSNSLVLNANQLTFGSNDLSQTSFRIDSNANVGFGTNVPQSNLHIIRTGISSIQITSPTESKIILGRSLNPYTNASEIKFGNINSDGAYFYSTSNSLDIINHDCGSVNNYLHVGNPTGIGTGNFNWIYGKDINNPLMTLTYQGNLGIGITDPIEKLKVVGIASIQGDLYVEQNIIGISNISAQGTITAFGDITTTNGSLGVGNNLTVTNTTTLNGDTTLNGPTNTLNNLTIINDSLEINGSINFNSAINQSSGISTFYDLEILNNLSAKEVAIGADAPRGYSLLDVLGLSLFESIGVGQSVPLSGLDARGSHGLLGGLTISDSISGFSFTPTSIIDFSNAGITSLPTKRFMIPPKLTTTQRNAQSSVEGGVIYNTSLHRLEVYNGTGWVGIATTA